MFVLIFAAAIGSGLVARIFFAFSSFVMAALGRLPSDHGIAAMNAINVTVINPVFFLAFFGTAALCVAASAGVVLRWTTSERHARHAGERDLPRRLHRRDDAAQRAAEQCTGRGARWARRGRRLVDALSWRMDDLWNTVRTVAPVLSAILFTVALL